MNTNLPPFKIFSGTKSHYLAEAICAELGVELGKMNIQHFADGEFEVSFEESIRGCEVFLVQSTFPNTDNLMELLLMIDEEWNGMEWDGMEWNGLEWNGMKWNEMEWNKIV